jgi:hypothetical protein
MYGTSVLLLYTSTCKKIVWKTSGLQKYGVLSDLFEQLSLTWLSSRGCKNQNMNIIKSHGENAPSLQYVHTVHDKKRYLKKSNSCGVCFGWLQCALVHPGALGCAFFMGVPGYTFYSGVLRFIREILGFAWVCSAGWNELFCWYKMTHGALILPCVLLGEWEWGGG